MKRSYALQTRVLFFCCCCIVLSYRVQYVKSNLLIITIVLKVLEFLLFLIIAKHVNILYLLFLDTWRNYHRISCWYGKLPGSSGAYGKWIYSRSFHFLRRIYCSYDDCLWLFDDHIYFTRVLCIILEKFPSCAEISIRKLNYLFYKNSAWWNICVYNYDLKSKIWKNVTRGIIFLIPLVKFSEW